MSFDIVSKNTNTLNRAPVLSELRRGEIVVNHRTAPSGLIRTSLGLFLRVGSAAAEDVDDKVIRIGNPYVTNGEAPDLIQVNNQFVDYTGELWYDKEKSLFYINVTGDETGWQEVIPYATRTRPGLVQFATTAEIIAGNGTKGLTAQDLIAAWSSITPVATETNKGDIELATTQEVILGADTTRAVTPKGLHDFIPTIPKATENSYGPTRLATEGETLGGVANNVAVSPLHLRNVLTSNLSNIESLIGSSSTYSIYCDRNNPAATDDRTNRGTSSLKPFRSLERALLEATRRSFVSGATNDTVEKITIHLGQGEYIVQNGRGGNSPSVSYNRFQDASQLILLNKDWLIQQALLEIPVAYRTASCSRDLGYYVDAIANDVAGLGNKATILAARELRRADGTAITAYDSAEEVEYTLLALESLRTNAITALKNNGPVRLPNISPDRDSNGVPVLDPCINVQTQVHNLVDILAEAVSYNPQNPSSVNPWSLAITDSAGTASFPSTGEPQPGNLRSFNDQNSSGIILPRGVSIIGVDYRKVVIRPEYVPRKDGTEGRGSIFKLTGGNYICGFTVKDKLGLNESHHNLSVFEFASPSELTTYYSKVALVFQDSKNYNRLQDAANLVTKNQDWILKKVVANPLFTTELDRTFYEQAGRSLLWAIANDFRTGGNENVITFAQSFSNTYLVQQSTAEQNRKTQLFRSAAELTKGFINSSITNLANVAEGGYRDPRISPDLSGPNGTLSSDPCSAVKLTAATLVDIVLAVIQGTEPPVINRGIFTTADVEARLSETEMASPAPDSGPVPETDSTKNCSPYIYEVALRSDFGMCGALLDARRVTGFKSIEVSQFTIISNQRDLSVFQKHNGTSWVDITDFNDYLATDTNNIRYKATGPFNFTDGSYQNDTRHFGFKLIAGAFIQEVSEFTISTAIHHWVNSGSDADLSNCNAAFGGVATLAHGFRGIGTAGGAFPSDQNLSVLAVKRPLFVKQDGTNIRKTTIADLASTGAYVVVDGSEAYLKLAAPFIPKQFEESGITLQENHYIWVKNFNASIGPGAFANRAVDVRAQLAANPWREDFPDRIYVKVNANNNLSTLGTTPAEIANELAENTVYVRRLIDTRSAEERETSLLVGTTASTTRQPLPNYVLRLANRSALANQLDPANGPDQLFFNSEVALLNRTQVPSALALPNGRMFKVIVRAGDSVNNFESNAYYRAGYPVYRQGRVYRAKKTIKTTNFNVDDWTVALQYLPDGRGIELPRVHVAPRIILDKDLSGDPDSVTLGVDLLTDPDYLAQQLTATDHISTALLLRAVGYQEADIGYRTSSLTNKILAPQASEEARWWNPGSLAAPAPTGKLNQRGSWAIEFCKPSIIEATNQLYRYVGLGNYSKALPKYQTSVAQPQLRIDAVGMSVMGGRPYADGSLENGLRLQGDIIRDFASGRDFSVEYAGIGGLDGDIDIKPARDVTGELEALAQSIADLNSSSVSLRRDLNDLNGQVRELAQLVGIITSIQGSTTQIQTALNALGARVSTLETSLLALRDEVNDIRADLNALEALVNTINNNYMPKSGGTFTGDVTFASTRKVRFLSGSSSNGVSLAAASSMQANITLVLPSTLGNEGEVLGNAGNGTMAWQSPAKGTLAYILALS